MRVFLKLVVNKKTKMVIDYEESHTRIYSFSGKKQDWSAWEERFLASARRKGFKQILLGATQFLMSKKLKV